MSINSTKHRKRKSRNRTNEVIPLSPQHSPDPQSDQAPAASVIHLSNRAWLTTSFIIIIIAVGLRTGALELKPMHHDEGVNGYFLTNLVRNGDYKYDPSNYHGPTLYYLTLPSVV